MFRSPMTKYKGTLPVLVPLFSKITILLVVLVIVSFVTDIVGIGAYCASFAFKKLTMTIACKMCFVKD